MSFAQRITRASLGGAALFAASPAWAQDSVVDSGDTAWILASTALVLFMTLPGLALFTADGPRRRLGCAGRA